MIEGRGQGMRSSASEKAKTGPGCRRHARSLDIRLSMDQRSMDVHGGAKVRESMSGLACGKGQEGKCEASPEQRIKEQAEQKP